MIKVINFRHARVHYKQFTLEPRKYKYSLTKQKRRSLLKLANYNRVFQLTDVLFRNPYITKKKFERGKTLKNHIHNYKVCNIKI